MTSNIIVIIDLELIWELSNASCTQVYLRICNLVLLAKTGLSRACQFKDQVRVILVVRCRGLFNLLDRFYIVKLDACWRNDVSICSFCATARRSLPHAAHTLLFSHSVIVDKACSCRLTLKLRCIVLNLVAVSPFDLHLDCFACLDWSC